MATQKIRTWLKWIGMPPSLVERILAFMNRYIWLPIYTGWAVLSALVLGLVIGFVGGSYFGF